MFDWSEFPIRVDAFRGLDILLLVLLDPCFISFGFNINYLISSMEVV